LKKNSLYDIKTKKKYFTTANVALIISSISLLLFVIFISLYFSLWYNRVNSKNIISILNGSDGNFSTLTVSGESNLNQTFYRKKIENITLQSETTTLDVSEAKTGSTFVLNSNGEQTYFMRNVFDLPDATGSGRFYEYVFNDNITFSIPQDGFLKWTSTGARFMGSISYGIQGLADGETDGIASTPDNSTIEFITIAYNRPFIAETGVSGGVYSGSILKFTDVKTDLYQVEGILIGNSGMSVANFTDPFDDF
jgi:hypothetical protein